MTTTCLACPAGKYSGIGAFTCTPCALGTYSSSNGASACVGCTAHSTTQATGSTSPAQCICVEGYGYNAGACIACSVGRYRDATGVALGNIQCDACQVGKYQAGLGATACDDCPANTWTALEAGDSLDACVCNAGFGGTSTSCAQCTAGTYRNQSEVDIYSDLYANVGNGYQYATICSSCDAGRSTNNQAGQTTCDWCSTSTYSNLPGKFIQSLYCCSLIFLSNSYDVMITNNR